jgi:hypothetical protein
LCSIIKNSWCLKCSGNEKHTVEDCRLLANKNNIECLSDKYKNNKSNLLWRCYCGFVWLASYNNVSLGEKCPKCANNVKHTIEWCQKLATNNNVKCLSSVYTSMHSKLEWKCSKEHVWFAKPNDIQQGHLCAICGREKSKQTCIKKYGVDSPMKCKEISLQVARSQNNSYISYHWKTGEELVCQASYEYKTTKKLNEICKDYLWQPKAFTMPDGRTYRPDLYLIREDKWVEIKGYFRDKAKEKWEWFHKEYPNSELWDKETLKRMGVL